MMADSNSQELDTKPPPVLEISSGKAEVDTNAPSLGEDEVTSHAATAKTRRFGTLQRRSTEPTSNFAKATKDIKDDSANGKAVQRAAAGGNANSDKRTSIKMPLPALKIGVNMDRQHHDDKVVGMEEGLRRFMARATSMGSRKSTHTLEPEDTKGDRHRRIDSGQSSLVRKRDTIEADEGYARRKAESRPFAIFILSGFAAVKVFWYYLITLDSLLSCILSVGLTLFWYFRYEGNTEWAGRMDWVLLGFAVVTPLSVALSIAFTRRERALYDIARIRSSMFQIYEAHTLWDWSGGGGRARCKSMDWLGHADAVLKQLVGIGDELCRFLTLPTSSRTRHRIMHSGRKEAARTVEVAYRLFDSLYTQRLIRLTIYAEKLKDAGLGASEISRIRQYERFIGEAIEDLRMIKMYRTPQALRSFGRLFTTLLPPFYAPTYAQLARNVDSLGIGIAFSLITAIGLTALFESIQQLEDPFVGFLTLDGIGIFQSNFSKWPEWACRKLICFFVLVFSMGHGCFNCEIADVREEFKVLNWQQLVNAREVVFPYASPFPEESSSPIADPVDDSPAAEFGDVGGYSEQTGGELDECTPASVRTGPRPRLSTEGSLRTSAYFLNTSGRFLGGSPSDSSRAGQANI